MKGDRGQLTKCSQSRMRQSGGFCQFMLQYTLLNTSSGAHDSWHNQFDNLGFSYLKWGGHFMMVGIYQKITKWY